MKQEFGKTLNGLASGYGMKLVLVALLLLCFLPPLAMVHNIISDREMRSRSTREEVIASWGGRTDLSGPYLLVPMTCLQEEILENGKKHEYQITRTAVLFPESLRADINAETEIRSRGIYHVPVFLADVSLTGSFRPDRIEKEYPEYTLHWDEARLALNVQHLEGIRGFETARLSDREITFEPSANTPGPWGPRIAAPVDLTGFSSLSGSDSNTEQIIPYDLKLKLGGGGNISLIPIARQTTANIDSDWPAPGFFGTMLPETRQYSEEGFSATWNISHLSRNLPAVTTLTEIDQITIPVSGFGVNFYQPDDPYIKNDRSFKYAWLFLIVPFITFFLFEIIRRHRIHPVQYLLAGSADVVFYLLLLSISEHLGFSVAYLIATASITLLLGAYGTTVLHGVKEGALLGGMIALAYGYLHIVLQSEDYALLLGSVGLFFVLAAIMFLTRKINWYRQEAETQTVN